LTGSSFEGNWMHLTKCFFGYAGVWIFDETRIRDRRYDENDGIGIAIQCRAGNGPASSFLHSKPQTHSNLLDTKTYCYIFNLRKHSSLDSR
jgi:hypothetical protein